MAGLYEPCYLVVRPEFTSTLTIKYMEKENYNGWSNYATWRVMLEMFDDERDGIYEGYTDTHELEEALKETAHDIITGMGELEDTHIAVQYADAFLSEVNFYEIAEHIIEEMKNNKQ